MLIENPLGKQIAQCGREIHYLISEKLNKLNLGSGQFFIVIKVVQNEGISQNALSKLMHVDKTTAAKGIKKVIAEGYIRKERDEEDKRCYKLYPTEKGKDIYPQIMGILNEVESKVMSGFSEEELIQFISFLDRVRDNVKK